MLHSKRDANPPSRELGFEACFLLNRVHTCDSTLCATRSDAFGNGMATPAQAVLLEKPQPSPISPDTRRCSPEIQKHHAFPQNILTKTLYLQLHASRDRHNNRKKKQQSGSLQVDTATS
ncbi:unnamed protein product [Ectocarpus sp. 12 AP-2014]